MSDHDGFCKCPVLRMAAEMDRMAGCGIIPEGAEEAGAFRQREGCRGPSGGHCPFDTHMALGLTTDSKVPLVRPKDDRDVPGSYL